MKKSVWIIFVVIMAVILYYYILSPEENSFLMLQCPSKLIFGIDCALCGGQRALHAALHGDFEKAFSYNPFLVIALPYILLFIYSLVSKSRLADKLLKIVGNKYVVMTFFVFMLIWTVVRNFL